jgi:UDP-N-acetylmuramoyl-L-alanyl-D-glutamate--2,6-diaminopimelate ligase
MNAIKRLFPQQLKNIYHLVRAIVANVRYGFPSKKIKVIGITGTNGKTTTTQMVTRILEEAGEKVAMASTINFKIGEKEWINATKYTTLSPFSVQKFILQAVNAGCEYLVLETSSHSLDQYRVWGVAYDTAVITNVTREHLDYHDTMKKYRDAKKKLFEKVTKNKGTIIVNLDMEEPEEFLSFCAGRKIAYTTKMQNDNTEFETIRPENIELDIDHSNFILQGIGFKLNLPGMFNVENALAATCVGLSENISLENISKTLSRMERVPGRFELVANDMGISIIIDYAVTPDSLEKLYELIRNVRKNPCNIGKNSQIIAVFGSCGERDRGKRPIMGEIVSKSADIVVITNEDPYCEDPQRIIDEVASGVKNKIEGDNFLKIMDRREAIKKALTLANPGDIVVVTGKGAEETMAIGKERIPWNERKVIEEVLREI